MKSAGARMARPEKGGVMPAPQSLLERQIRSKWWVLVVMGLISLAAGIVALAYPDLTLLVLGIIFGAYLLVWGIFTLGMAFVPNEPVVLRVLSVMIGFFAMLAGLFCLVRPGASVLVLLIALGFWFVLVGVGDIVRGIEHPDYRWFNILLGLLAVAAGVVVLGNPDIGLDTLALLVGLGLLARGVIEASAGLWVRFG
jgi:uncharacterized membrane protein HdeD (DUF308 family)